MSETVRACPLCGTERRVYKCECESPGRIEPIDMPAQVAERLRHFTRESRGKITATFGKYFVWVEWDRVQIRDRSGPCLTLSHADWNRISPFVGQGIARHATATASAPPESATGSRKGASNG